MEYLPQIHCAAAYSHIDAIQTVCVPPYAVSSVPFVRPDSVVVSVVSVVVVVVSLCSPAVVKTCRSLCIPYTHTNTPHRANRRPSLRSVFRSVPFGVHFTYTSEPLPLVIEPGIVCVYVYVKVQKN